MATRQVTIQGKTYTVRDPSGPVPPAAPEPSPSPAAPSEGRSINLPHPSGNRTVTLTMLVSFGTFLLAGSSGIAKLQGIQRYLVTNPTATDSTVAKYEQGGPATGGGTVLNVRSLFGWAFLFVILTILADFDSTSELAGAMSTLIMLTTLLALGPDALANIGKFTGAATS